MRGWFLAIPLLAFLALGCARPDVPALQPGDVVRPEVSFAPKTPWPADARVNIGVLARVERPGGEGHYLKDEDVLLEQVVMSARLTFFDGERVLGEPVEVPLVHDC